MRKLLIVLFTAFLFLLVNESVSWAQGIYGCIWENGSCVLDETEVACSSQTGNLAAPDYRSCSEITDSAGCNSIVFACTVSPANTGWACASNNTCVEVVRAQGTYLSRNDCLTACDSPNTAGVSGQGFFDCGDPNNTGLCAVAPSSQCGTGYRADSGYCAQFDGDSGTCNNQTGIACITDNSTSTVQGTYKCENDSCIQCGAGETCPYNSLQQCAPNCANATVTVQAVPLNLSRGCNPDTEINTAIGCIPLSDTNAMAAFFLRWALGIGGGIAFLLIVYSGFIIMTSQGDPRRLEGGKELMTAAISGILLIIFSVFVLRILGVNVLGIF